MKGSLHKHSIKIMMSKETASKKKETISFVGLENKLNGSSTESLFRNYSINITMIMKVASKKK
jgi:hypothetical protein